jgi:L-rhamnose mutarotase
MKRVGFNFKIKPELKNGYKKAHDEVWPEQVQAVKDCGISNYSIFFKKDGNLFAYLEIEGDFNEAMAKLAKMEINQKWQKYMDQYFVKEDKSILGPEMEILEEVAHVD